MSSLFLILTQVGGVEECLRLYEERVRNTSNLFNSISELEGLELGCWCKPNYCHGEVLIKLYNEFVCENDALFK